MTTGWSPATAPASTAVSGSAGGTTAGFATATLGRRCDVGGHVFRVNSNYRNEILADMFHVDVPSPETAVFARTSSTTGSITSEGVFFLIQQNPASVGFCQELGFAAAAALEWAVNGADLDKKSAEMGMEQIRKTILRLCDTAGTLREIAKMERDHDDVC